MPESLIGYPRLAVAIAVFLVGVVCAACGGGATLSNSTPSCSWPMHVTGTATTEQVGLVHCYLQALSQRNTAELTEVMGSTGSPGHIIPSDLTYSVDARDGLASANFMPNPSDDTYVKLTITYGNGATEVQGIYNMTEFGGPSVWRMSIGSDWDPSSSSSGPKPAMTGSP